MSSSTEIGFYESRIPVPHWARVAFAARCARTVLPLFAARWPAAPARHHAALAAAVEAAEFSAGNACQHPELKNLSTQSVMAAGAAYCADQGLSINGVAPVRSAGDNPIRASFAARAAHMAIESALASAAEDARPAVEAFSSACEAAEGADDLIDRMHDDLDRLIAESRRGGWTDESPVPPRLFDDLAKNESVFTRLWHKFR
jgi:hypothetical protein